MLFNSLHFCIFFPLVIILYYLIPDRRRWMLLLPASYYFYMCWKPEFAILIFVSTVIDYFAGIMMGRTDDQRKRLKYLALSLASNLGILFTFKYFNFFNEQARAIFDYFNIFYDIPTFHLMLPVAISFYTFQSVSYTVEVYQGNLKPEKHFGLFAVYVAFFPQLVAGPIERSTNLLPQFSQPHPFSMARAMDGVQLMLWGYFKKLVIADRFAIYVNEVFNNPDMYHGWPVVLAPYMFAFQVYADFSGYSDIAIGAAQIMGYQLMDNFRKPYFSENIREFWKRWHISLTSWFRLYLFIPIGGSRVPNWRRQMNVMIVFLVSGLWHGANWTYIIWGFLHGMYYLISEWTAGFREKVAQATGIIRYPRIHRLVRILITFQLVNIAYVFFRAASVQDIVKMFHAMFMPDTTGQGIYVGLNATDFWIGICAVIALLLMESRYPILPENGLRSPFAMKGPIFRGVFCYALIMSILILGKFVSSPFIYFQF